MMGTETIPTFPVQRRMVTGLSGQRYEAFKFQCPTCKKVNIHSPENGYRIAHCPCYPRGYYIQEET
jgi:hypothetical protein